MLVSLLERVQAMVMGNERFERRRERLERTVHRRQNDLAQLQAEGLGWRGGVVLGWAGMRGVVTLAAAQSLPKDTPYYERIPRVALVPRDGTPLPQLDLPERALFVLGAEREGLPDDVLAAASVSATISQSGEAESLNVATAGAIALYEWRRRRA